MLSIILLVVFCSIAAYASTTCEMDDCKITITINLAFTGASQDYMDRAENEIEDVWNGPDGFRTTGDCECPVTYKVNTMNITNASQQNCSPGPPNYHCIKVTPYNTDPPKAGNETYIAFMWGMTNGTSINGWWSDICSRQITGSTNHYTDFAHEAGHLMGLPDDYNRTSGQYGANLMGQTWPPNNQPTQDQKDQSVENVCGANACPDYCCCGNGKVDKNKGEACDPFAEPNGCGSNEYCCPVCCQCYDKMCIPENGEYASESACDSACTDGKCYYNYQTGCWDCLRTKPVETPSSYDTTVKQVEGIFDEHSEEHEPIETEIIQLELVGGYTEEVYEPVLQRNKPEVIEEEEIEEVEEEIDEVEEEVLEEEIVEEEDIFEHIKEMNYNMIDHPLMSKLFADERIDVYIEDISSEPYAHVITADGRIVNIEQGPVNEPSINIYTNTETVEMLMTGEISFEQALDEGSIRYEGVGFFNGIRIGVMDFFYNLFT